MSQKEKESQNTNLNFAKIEQDVLKKWKKENTFQKSLKGTEEFIFYDGPPFTNGLPHYGHLLTGFIKDIFARYQTMKGKKVDRKFGWDCHGLPAEMQSEKELGLSGGVEIEQYGIDKFNEHCRKSVLKYIKEWKDYVNRQARWVDFENGYKTMDIKYMESVLWAFKELYNKDLIYKSMRVMPYSWACETPVSDFETRIDNSYREKKSKAITVAFKLQKISSFLNKYKDIRLLAWTTTPWTLPSNLALAVGKNIEYVGISKDDKLYIIAKNLSKKYEKELGDKIVENFLGKDIVGCKYQPLYPYFKNHKNAFQILHGEFVTTEDGTGIVHMAPGFGEDDQVLCGKNGIEVVCPVDRAGKFTYPVADYLGKQVFEANDDIIKYMKNNDCWIQTEQYLHNYPHCWRTDTPLIYKAIPSWYVKVTEIKDKMIKNNQKINWIPGHIKNGLFGKWLENSRDWSISRNRFWGCPIPVWQSDDPKYPHIEVYGSIKELEESFGVKIEDIHRPYIDTLTKPNPKDPTGKSLLKRVPEVLDCWFESGSMSFAQVHYPFENKEWFETHFPADFIVEYLAQTRGWFYTMMVLGTALFNKPPFLNCICHGVILGDGGQKLSKRLKNYADPNLVFDTLGSDAMRWFMISSPVMRGQELVIDKDASGIKEAQKMIIKPLWNAFQFFNLYSEVDQIKAEFDLNSKNILDRYIVAKCIKTVQKISEGLDNYDTITATKASEEFVEVLNNWYIRRSRARFWRSEKDEDKISAYNTLYSVLHLFLRAIASLLPLITDKIYTELTDNKSGSIHLEHFPKDELIAVDNELITDMERVRDACNVALRIRNDAGIRVRQPLSKVTFVGVSESLISDELKYLILDEINVKSWENLPKDKIQDYANFKLKLNFPEIAKRMPGKIKELLQSSKEGNWEFTENTVKIADTLLTNKEFSLNLDPKEEYSKVASSLSTNDALVVLDLNITKELEFEGVARDIVRLVQQLRKDTNLNITDKIYLSFEYSDNDIKNVLSNWKNYIKEQTLCNDIEKDIDNPIAIKEFTLEEKNLIIKMSIAS